MNNATVPTEAAALPKARAKGYTLGYLHVSNVICSKGRTKLSLQPFTFDQSTYAAIAAAGAGFLTYSAIGNLLDRWSLSPSMFFCGIGVVCGPLAADAISTDAARALLRVYAELTLAIVLCIQSARLDFRVFRRGLKIPSRLILVALPISIGLGAILAWAMFPTLGWAGALLLAIILAPTDADLARPVVTDARVEERSRLSLEVESGLNDGVCVPLLLSVAAISVGGSTLSESGAELALQYIFGEIGIGGAVGSCLGLLFIGFARLTKGQYFVRGSWRILPFISLAFVSFGSAQLAGGSGLIAAFVAGLAVSFDSYERRSGMLDASEGLADVLSSLTWICFGILLFPLLMAEITNWSLLYAVLSLTIVRTLPVFVALLWTGIWWREKAFLAWFGPRGLASIVFVMLLLDKGIIEVDSPIFHTVFLTVFLSVVLHGVTARPLIALMARRTWS